MTIRTYVGHGVRGAAKFSSLRRTLSHRLAEPDQFLIKDVSAARSIVPVVLRLSSDVRLEPIHTQQLKGSGERMNRQVMRFAQTNAVVGLLLIMTGCASEYDVFHTQTGEPLLLSRRAYTREACLEQIHADGTQLGVTFRYVHVRGSLFGQSLLWPFEAGYACEAAIGPEEKPQGIYPREHSPLLAHIE
jgi:hypothetical protein